jgi:membrane protease YdiL (CAAX protease family)
MSTEGRISSAIIILPLWQVILVIVGLPALYIVNSLLPWSTGLFQEREHAFFWQFWSSIAVLHWSSFALVSILLKRAGRRLSDIGLQFSPFRVAVMVGIPAIVGLVLTVVHKGSGGTPGPLSNPQLPVTMAERLFWIFSSVTAGFCEGVIYRGFGIRVLQGRNMGTWLAVGVATLAFFFMHGPALVIGNWRITLMSFLIIYSGGLLFSVLFLWRRSLVPGICLHALIDITNI